MSVAFDAYTALTEGTGELSGNHTPSGTPKGVLVWVGIGNSTPANPVDEITGITYGGQAMSRIANGRVTLSGGTDAEVYGYFLGSSIPTGQQSVVVSVTADASPKLAQVITMTATGDTEVKAEDHSIVSASVENPSASLALGGVECFVAIGGVTGRNLASQITELANWTNRGEPAFASASERALVYTYDVVGTTDVTVGWTQVADMAVALAVAVGEAAGGGGNATLLHMMHNS